MPRIFNITTNLFGNVSAGSFTTWANSLDKYRFTFLQDTNTPEDLTNKNVGAYLFVGPSRATAQCRRPSINQVAPDDLGVEVVNAKDGRIDFQFQQSDVLASDTSLWIEFWADVFPGGLTAESTTSGGALAADTWTYVVTAVTPDGETLGQERIAVTTTAVSTVVLNWEAVPGATAYKVYRKSETTPTFEFFNVGNVLTFTDDDGDSFTAGDPPSESANKYMLAQYRVNVAVN